MTSSIFAFDFAFEGKFSQYDAWVAFHEAFISQFFDPIHVYVAQRNGETRRSVLPNSIPAVEEFPRLPDEHLNASLGLTQLVERSRYLDLRPVSGVACQQLSKFLQNADLFIELWGPVKVFVAARDEVVQDWFLMQEWQDDFRRTRGEILRLGLRFIPGRSWLGLRVTSLSNVWSDIDETVDLPGEHRHWPQKAGAAMLAAEKNVQSLANAIAETMAHLNSEHLLWSPFVDGEQPDRAGLMRRWAMAELGEQHRSLVVSPL